jgi:hypothetical protein
MQCEKIIKAQDHGVMGYHYKKQCTKTAQYVINGKNFCRHHAKKGRYVIREGDVGEIVARFDTEEEVRTAFSNYSLPYRMQKLTPSHKTDLYKHTS